MSQSKYWLKIQCKNRSSPGLDLFLRSSYMQATTNTIIFVLFLKLEIRFLHWTKAIFLLC